MDEQEYRERLAHDLGAWARGGLISGEQERAILARIGAGEPKAVGVLRLGWFVTAISIVGAVVLGAGVVLLFAANWNETPDWFRTVLVLVSILAAYGAGYALIYRFDMQRIGSALLLLGALLYEAGLFLLAQIYNMPVDSPMLFLLAAAGIFPLAYLFGSRIILLLAIGDLTGWVISALSQRYPDAPKAEAAILVVAVFGVALYATGKLHELRKALAAAGQIYIFGGLLVTLGLVYVFTFGEPWDAIIDEGVDAYAAPPIVYISIALTAVLVAAQWMLRPRDIESHIDVAAQAGILGLAAIVGTWPAWTGYSLIFNGVFFAATGGLVLRGYVRADERYVNLGLAGFALGVMTRYVDVFWSMLAGSAFFIIGGMLLLAIAFGVERFRRELLRSMAPGDAPPDDGKTTLGASGRPA